MNTTTLSQKKYYRLLTEPTNRHQTLWSESGGNIVEISWLYREDEEIEIISARWHRDYRPWLVNPNLFALNNRHESEQVILALTQHTLKILESPVKRAQAI